jgi:hypothetical protein
MNMPVVFGKVGYVVLEDGSIAFPADNWPHDFVFTEFLGFGRL